MGKVEKTKLNWFSSEFKCKHFGYADVLPERFYKSQWTDKAWFFPTYKLLMLFYLLGIYISDVILDKNRKFIWTDFSFWASSTVVIYQLASVGIYLHKKLTEKCSNNAEKGELQPVIHKIELDEATLKSYKEESYRSSREGTKLDLPYAENSENTQERNLNWGHKLVWLLHETAFDSSVVAAAAFYGFQSFSSKQNPLGTDISNTVLMLSDIFLSDIPVRLLHFYHILLYGIIYIVFEYVLYVSGYPVDYSLFNWVSDPALSLGVSAGVVAVSGPLCHALMFGLFQIRQFVARKTVLSTNTKKYKKSKTETKQSSIVKRK